VSSKRNYLVVDRLASYKPINGAESGDFTIERHSTQAVQLAREGERDRVIDEVVPADAVTMHGEQVPVKAADNGDEIHSVLDGVGVGCCFLLDRVGTIGVGSSAGHHWLLGFSFRSSTVSHYEQ
jgi:hypothetical protein